MITRILVFVSAVVVGMSALNADEAINKAYFERGIETARIVKGDANKFIAHYSEQLQAIRNGVYEGDKKDKGKEEERLTKKLEYYNDEIRKPFQTPRINVFNVDVPTGAVGVMDSIGPYDSIADPVRPYQVKVAEVDENGFVAEVKFANAKKAYFRGFDKSKIAVDKEIELTDVVLVVGQMDTSLGSYLTIRKLTEQELRDAMKFAKANTPNPNFREWSDSAGKFKIKAEFVSVDSGTVTLKKDDDTEVKMQLSKLSKADREWIKEHRVKQ